MNTETTSKTSPVVLITGALSGIGHATALAFAQQGARIVISGRHQNIGEEFAAELTKLGAEVEFIAADVRDDDQVSHLVGRVVARFGRLDIAVNNAGTEGTPGMITDQTADSYNATFQTNVLGVLLSMKHQLRVMQAQGSGSIINISSAYGRVGAAGASVYAASKHAVEGLTKSAAHEAAPFGVRVNAVAPGPIDTGMLTRFTGGNDDNKKYLAGELPMKRIGKPSEIADVIVFVSSDKASFITGQTIGVDGGRLA